MTIMIMIMITIAIVIAVAIDSYSRHIVACRVFLRYFETARMYNPSTYKGLLEVMTLPPEC